MEVVVATSFSQHQEKRDHSHQLLDKLGLSSEQYHLFIPDVGWTFI